MKTITIITKDPAVVEDYYGFGAYTVEHGKTKFDDQVVIAHCPDEHAEYNVG